MFSQLYKNEILEGFELITTSSSHIGQNETSVVNDPAISGVLTKSPIVTTDFILTQELIRDQSSGTSCQTQITLVLSTP